jgi:hypothetical protein
MPGVGKRAVYYLTDPCFNPSHLKQGIRCNKLACIKNVSFGGIHVLPTAIADMSKMSE